MTHRLLTAWGTAGLALSAILLPPSSAWSAETDPWLTVVRRYADAMLENGRDAYGPQHSGLLLSALDRGGLAPLATRPAPPAGVREGDRPGPAGGPLVGSNPQLDQNLLRVLYALSEVTGERRYAEAAEAALRWFLNHTASPATHLLPWGEHLSWDVMNDEPASGHQTPVHEFSRPWVLWDRCYALAPKASEAFALGLWEHQIGDQATGAYDRHASFLTHGPRTEHDFPRHGGFYIGTWAPAYTHTEDETFLKAIEALVTRFERKRHPDSGLINAWAEEPYAWPPSELSLAIDCEDAARRVPEPLASRLRRFVDREDEVFCGLAHEPADQGFVINTERATGKPLALPRYEPHSTPWGAGYGDTTTGMLAMMCLARYEQVHKKPYRVLIVAAADAYLEHPRPETGREAWPMTAGHAISTLLAAHRMTDRDAYLDAARSLATWSVEAFWQDRPLPRASLRSRHYEAITGGDTLALALLQLHAAERINGVRPPANTIDR